MRAQDEKTDLSKGHRHVSEIFSCACLPELWPSRIRHGWAVFSLHLRRCDARVPTGGFLQPLYLSLVCGLHFVKLNTSEMKFLAVPWFLKAVWMDMGFFTWYITMTVYLFTSVSLGLLHLWWDDTCFCIIWCRGPDCLCPVSCSLTVVYLVWPHLKQCWSFLPYLITSLFNLCWSLPSASGIPTVHMCYSDLLDAFHFSAWFFFRFIRLGEVTNVSWTSLIFPFWYIKLL